MTQNTEHQPKTTIETPSTHETRSAVFPEAKEPKGRKRQMAIMGGLVVGLASVGGLGAYLASSSESNTPEPAPEPSVEAPVVPGEVDATPSVEATESTDPTPTETEVTGEIIFDVEPIPADLPAEELAAASNGLWETWSMSGATDETISATDQGWLEYNDGGLESYISEVAQRNAEPFVEAYFPTDWESNQDLVDYYQGVVDANQGYIESALSRINKGEPLIKVTSYVSEVVELPAPEGQRILEFRIDGVRENSTSEYRGGVVNETFDISDGTARLIAQESTPNL